MNLLEHLNNRHPIASAVLGIAGAAGGWFFAHIEEINQIGGLIGLFLGLYIASITAALKYREWRNRNSRFRSPEDQKKWEEDNLSL